MSPINLQLFFAAFALVSLTFVILFTMGFKRFKAAKNKEVDVNYYKLYQEANEPENIRKFARNFSNLFEVPVMFYAAIAITLALNVASNLLVYLAWGYVALRYLHSYVHCTSNKVINRFRIYVISCLVLIAYWVILALKVAGA
ncbi:MAPEG family protein [Aliikangiella sp. IMCC44653]